MKFAQLSTALNETANYTLNQKGKDLLSTFHKFIISIEDNIVPVVKPLVTDIETFKKQIAVQIISTINSHKIGTEEFDVASRLDSFTSGGTRDIDSSRYTFNPEDKIFEYIEQVQSR